MALCTATTAAQDLTLLTLDPGHFHAALFQRNMLPGVAPEAYVYAPLGPDLTAHLNRLVQFNTRPNLPTCWRLNLHTGPDFMERMLTERRGQMVVISGRNRGKMDRILACVRAGLHVLADKPWIIEEEDLPKLRVALDTAEAAQLIAYDAMTQRFEITAILQRALVGDREVFGSPLPGSCDEPTVLITSLHYLFKEVAGQPNLRPAWFFDTAEQGEGLSDVGTHLVDLVPWILFPNQPIDDQRDLQVLRGTHWPTSLKLEELQRVTGDQAVPLSLEPSLRDERLDYFCNNTVDYTLRGLQVRLQTTWEYCAPPGRKDTESLVFRGSRARVEVRQDAEHQFRREVVVVPNLEADRALLLAAVRKNLAALEPDWPGLGVAPEAGGIRILIPESFRASHEEHFDLVAQRFLSYVRNPATLPAWEKPNMLAKYRVTTRGVALARQRPDKP
jgi:predicted dehydrogenase